MYISEKFDKFYNSLSQDDQLKAAKAVLVLCEDHERYMSKKKKELQELLQQAATAAAALDLEKFSKIRVSAERIYNNIIPIERFIEINFGL